MFFARPGEHRALTKTAAKRKNGSAALTVRGTLHDPWIQKWSQETMIRKMLGMKTRKIGSLIDPRNVTATSMHEYCPAKILIPSTSLLQKLTYCVVPHAVDHLVMTERKGSVFQFFRYFHRDQCGWIIRPDVDYIVNCVGI